MTQPKIQQWQADVVGGGAVQYYASFYREVDLSLPSGANPPAAFTTFNFDQVYYDVGDWRYDSLQFAAPAGLTHMRIQAHAKFKMNDNSAIPSNVTLYMIITNPNDPTDTIANFSLRGAGIASSDPVVGDYLDSIYLTTGWRPASPGNPFSVRVQHNYPAPSPILLTRAWITMEGV